MKILLVLTFLLPSLSLADDVSNIYWSAYACDGYIYHFDTAKNKYKIYTRLEVKDKQGIAYSSYQLSEGEIHKSSEAVYSLTGKDLTGVNTVDFKDKDQAIFNSELYGRAVLIQCDSELAVKLIAEAETHFKVCPKNVLNCKSL